MFHSLSGHGGSARVAPRISACTSSLVLRVMVQIALAAAQHHRRHLESHWKLSAVMPGTGSPGVGKKDAAPALHGLDESCGVLAQDALAIRRIPLDGLRPIQGAQRPPPSRPGWPRCRALAIRHRQRGEPDRAAADPEDEQLRHDIGVALRGQEGHTGASRAADEQRRRHFEGAEQPGQGVGIEPRFRFPRRSSHRSRRSWADPRSGPACRRWASASASSRTPGVSFEKRPPGVMATGSPLPMSLVLDRESVDGDLFREAADPVVHRLVEALRGRGFRDGHSRRRAAIEKCACDSNRAQDEGFAPTVKFRGAIAVLVGVLALHSTPHVPGRDSRSGIGVDAGKASA